VSATLPAGVVSAALPAVAVAEGGDATVVRELPDKRSEYAKVYLLSDGSFRSICYQSPIHYKDESGDWQPIDTSLVPVAGIDTYATVAAPVEVTLADEAPGQKPVTVESGDYLVTMNLVGYAENEKLVFDDCAIYIHYGYIGAALHLSLGTLRAGSVYAMGWRLGIHSYVREAVDQVYLSYGYALYWLHGHKGSGGGPSEYRRTYGFSY